MGQSCEEKINDSKLRVQVKVCTMKKYQKIKALEPTRACREGFRSDTHRRISYFFFLPKKLKKKASKRLKPNNRVSELNKSIVNRGCDPARTTNLYWGLKTALVYLMQRISTTNSLIAVKK